MTDMTKNVTENPIAANAEVGIDSLALYTPAFYIDLVELARKRGVDPDKFTNGIGQDQQAVAPSNQDIVTMGAAAALKALYFSGETEAAGFHDVGLLIVGTESGVDASKASALFVHDLIGLTPWCRCLEIKEACFGGTAALLTAYDYVKAHPDKKALVIAADIARYGLDTPGEVTQGAGAMAMVVSRDPRLMVLEPHSTAYSASIGDFWRPVYTDMALARGKYSTEQYVDFFGKVWKRYGQETGRTLADFAALCFHLPYTKMGMKAFKPVLDAWELLDEGSSGSLRKEPTDRLRDRYRLSTVYSRRVGNIYSGSLYLGLLSLLDNDPSLQEGDRIGLFSYGSGAVGEFFSGILRPGFRQVLHSDHTRAMLDKRFKLAIDSYERVFQDVVPYGPEDFTTTRQLLDKTNPFILDRVEGQERIYRRLWDSPRW